MKLLLAIDGSNGSDLAIDSVFDSDWPADTSVHVISVSEPVNKSLDVMSLGIGAMAEKAQKALEDDLQVMLDECVAKLKGKFSKVTSALLKGNAIEQILSTASDMDATLLVVGGHGTGAASAADFGKVALTLAAKAPCSVKVVSELSEPTLKKNGGKMMPARHLIAVNESDNSRAVLELISKRPWDPESSFQVLSVVPESKRAERSRFFKATAIAETEEKVQAAQKVAAETLVKEATEKLKAAFPKGKVTGHVLVGSPRNLILQVAQDWPADQIIIGAHDHKDSIFANLAGSTASAIVVHSGCSVLLVRPKD